MSVEAGNAAGLHVSGAQSAFPPNTWGWFRGWIELTASAAATPRYMHAVNLAAAAGNVVITLPAAIVESPLYVGVTNESALTDGSKVTIVQTSGGVEVARLSAAGETVWLALDPFTSTWSFIGSAKPTNAPLAAFTGASNTIGLTQAGRRQPVDPGGTSESFSRALLPLNSVTPLPIGFTTEIQQSTDGIVAIVGATTAVTVLTTKSTQMQGRGALVTVEKVATDTWYISGDLQPPVRGMSQWNDSFAYQTAPDGGVKGSTAGFWVAVDGMINSQVLNTTRFLIGKSAGVGTGWGIQALTTNATIRGFAGFLVAGVLNTPAYTVVPDDIGKHNLVVIVYDPAGTGRLRLYVRDVEVGSGTDCGSAVFAPTAASIRTTLARRPDVGANAPSDWTIYGAVGGDAFVPTLAEIQNLYLRWKSTGTVQAIPGKTTRRWSIRTENVRHAPITVSDRQNLLLPTNLGTTTVTWAPGGIVSGSAPADLTFVEETAPVFTNP